MGNNNPKCAATLNSFGHYEDEMLKVNERVDKWAAKGTNPAWSPMLKFVGRRHILETSDSRPDSGGLRPDRMWR
jgi:hypothetical protein